MANDKDQFVRVIDSFGNVAIGQHFIEVFSPSNAIYERVEEFEEGGKSFNGQKVKTGKPYYKQFWDWEPVWVEKGCAND